MLVTRFLPVALCTKALHLSTACYPSAKEFQYMKCGRQCRHAASKKAFRLGPPCPLESSFSGKCGNDSCAAIAICSFGDFCNRLQAPLKDRRFAKRVRDHASTLY